MRAARGNPNTVESCSGQDGKMSSSASCAYFSPSQDPDTGHLLESIFDQWRCSVDDQSK